MNELAILAKGNLAEGKKEALEAFIKQKGLEECIKPASPFPHSQIREFMILFDATGSMSRVWGEAKEGIKKLLNRLKLIMPGVKISLIAYRDYCDQKTIELLPATDRLEELEQFIGTIRCGGGEDEPEAVEAALEKVLEGQSSFGILVGDAPPHGTQDAVVNGKDYRLISQGLKQAGKKIYTVATNQNLHTVSSFQEIADITGGKFFQLEQVDELIDILSVAAAKRIDKMPLLAQLIKNEQGGRLTEEQKFLLEQ